MGVAAGAVAGAERLLKVVQRVLWPVLQPGPRRGYASPPEPVFGGRSRGEEKRGRGGTEEKKEDQLCHCSPLHCPHQTALPLPQVPLAPSLRLPAGPPSLSLLQTARTCMPPTGGGRTTRSGSSGKASGHGSGRGWAGTPPRTAGGQGGRVASAAAAAVAAAPPGGAGRQQAQPWHSALCHPFAMPCMP